MMDEVIAELTKYKEAAELETKYRDKNIRELIRHNQLNKYHKRLDFNHGLAAGLRLAIARISNAQSAKNK